MRTIQSLIALALLVPASLVACKTPAEKDEEAREVQEKANVTITQAQIDTQADLALAKDKTAFKSLANQKIASMKRRRDLLEEQCSRSTKVSQVDARAALDDIDAMLLTAHNDLLVVDAAPPLEFEQAQIRVNQDLADVRRLIDDLDKHR